MFVIKHFKIYPRKISFILINAHFGSVYVYFCIQVYKHNKIATTKQNALWFVKADYCR